jgi:DNA-binding NarL/FixJ family response regulator
VRDLNGQVPQPWRGLLLDEQRTRPPDVESLRALGLTGREAQVLRLLACGKRTDDIARDLFISPQTVSKHLQHIYARLGVGSRAQAIARVLS